MVTILVLVKGQTSDVSVCVCLIPAPARLTILRGVYLACYVLPGGGRDCIGLRRAT